MCKADQSVINLQFNLHSGCILNLLNLFIVESCQVAPKRSSYCFSLLPRIAGLFTWQVHAYAGWALSDTSGMWQLVRVVWKFLPGILMASQPWESCYSAYKGPLGHNLIRIPREMRLGRQNSNFSASSPGPRRDSLKVNIAPEII